MSERPYLPCRFIIEFLADYLDGQLPAETVAEFERHLAICDSCVAYLASYKETIRLARTALDTAIPDPPQELVSAIVAALRRVP